jgi:hypothetical protein
MSKDLYKNSLLVVLLLFFYYKQKEDIDVYLNIIMNQFSNIKYIINNYLSIILNDKNKKIFKKKIDYVKSYFLKKNKNLDLKEETKNIVEIVLPEEINIEDINTIDLKETKKSNSILNILLNKYVILSFILAINYYKRKLINKSPINSNKKSDELDILNENIKDENENDAENKDINDDKNKDNNKDKDINKGENKDNNDDKNKDKDINKGENKDNNEDKNKDNNENEDNNKDNNKDKDINKGENKDNKSTNSE